LLLLTLSCAAGGPRVRPDQRAQPVLESKLDNFYRVSDDLYRSEQPGAADIPDLKALGIRTVFSLRHYHSDTPAFEQAGIAALHFKMDAGSVTIPELIAVLRQIDAARKPLLVHCWHGSDRTGFVVAGYRIVFMNWSPAEAVEELRLGGFGHHETTFPNIAKTLLEMDVAAVCTAVHAGISPATATPR